MPIFSFPSANFIEIRQQKNIFENDEKNVVSRRRTNAQAKTTFHEKIFAMKRQDGKIFLAYVSDDFKTEKNMLRNFFLEKIKNVRKSSVIFFLSKNNNFFFQGGLRPPSFP